MLSILYVSKSLLLEAEDQLQDLVRLAVLRNLDARVTGGLVHTGSHFAQVLEGPVQSVSAIMASILVDKRHEDVRIVARETVDDRQFPSWGMVLIDQLPLAQTLIETVLTARDESSLAKASEALVRTMRQTASGELRTSSD